MKKIYCAYGTVPDETCATWKYQKAEKEKGTESLLKCIMTENVPNMGQEMDIQIFEAQRTLSRWNSKRVTLGHIIIKLLKRQREF